MEQSIQLMAGVCFLVLGLSYMLRPKDWIAWVDNLQSKGRRGSLSLGIFVLVLGSFIVAFHPVWQGIPLVLTLLGILATIKGTMLVLFPGWLPAQLEKGSNNLQLLLKIKALLTMMLGVALLTLLYKGGL